MVEQPHLAEIMVRENFAQEPLLLCAVACIDAYVDKVKKAIKG